MGVDSKAYLEIVLSNYSDKYNKANIILLIF
jgi:hypothetical protein